MPILREILAFRYLLKDLTQSKKGVTPSGINISSPKLVIGKNGLELKEASAKTTDQKMGNSDLGILAQPGIRVKSNPSFNHKLSCILSGAPNTRSELTDLVHQISDYRKKILNIESRDIKAPLYLNTEFKIYIPYSPYELIVFSYSYQGIVPVPSSTILDYFLETKKNRGE